MNIQDLSSGKRKVILAIGIILFVLLMAVLQGLSMISSDKDDAATNPNANTSTARTLNYVGFGTLSEHGFTATQMDGIRYAFYKSSEKAKEYIIDTDTIIDAPYDSDNPTPTVQTTFVIIIDGKKFYTYVDKYTDFVTVSVKLIDSTTNKTTYDSRAIDASKIDTSASQNLGD